MEDEVTSYRPAKGHRGLRFTARHKRAAIYLLVIFIVFAIGVHRCSINHKKKAPVPQKIMVVVAKAEMVNVPVYLDALGNVTPTNTVTVVPEVNGIMKKVFFTEGQKVKAGSLLAQIDERPFQALLTQYEGQLARDMALLENAKTDLKRYQDLWAQDSVSKQTLDTQGSLVKQYEGSVKTDQGLVATAKVDLAFCRITSPINGQIGLRLVDPGNFVQTSSTGLFVINNVQPITVVFTLPEDNVPILLKLRKSRKKARCEAYDRSQKNQLAVGSLFAMDNQVNPTTGTVQLKAQFKNESESLFPNQFVNIKLLIEELSQVITIPTSAIIHSAQGDIVYKLNPDTHTVQSLPVVVKLVVGENTVIQSGVSVNDLIVKEGTDKLKDGTIVSVFDPVKLASGKSL